MILAEKPLPVGAHAEFSFRDHLLAFRASSDPGKHLMTVPF
jgi:hypothetical protein